MKLARILAVGVCVLFLLSTAVTPAPAGEETKAETQESGHLLRLEVLMTRFQGDTVIDRFPYSLALNAGGTAARVYGGIQLPIVVRREGSNTVMFKNAGGEVFAKAWELEDGRFKVEISTELGGVHAEVAPAPPDAGEKPSTGPTLRSFSTMATITLGDGQSTTLSDAADPVTGQTVKTEVTLHVVR